MTKGAPDVLFSQMRQSILWGNKQQRLSEMYQTVVNREMDGLASHALRLIAVGFKPLTAGQIQLT